MLLGFGFALGFVGEWLHRRLPLVLNERHWLGRRRTHKRRVLLSAHSFIGSLHGSTQMLLLMTFNVWVIVAIAAGKATGFYRYWEEAHTSDGAGDFMDEQEDEEFEEAQHFLTSSLGGSHH